MFYLASIERTVRRSDVVRWATRAFALSIAVSLAAIVKSALGGEPRYD
jgi:hypothetical protein